LGNRLNDGASLIGVGLATVLLAQLVNGLPIAMAIALIGWGSSLSTYQRSRPAARLPRLVLFAGIYAPLTALTAAAQFHLALHKLTAVWQIAAAVDAAIAVTLACLLLRWTVDRFTQPERVER
jgi:hypothetical protein